MSPNQETYRYAFPDSPPHISYGIPFDESCTKHVNQTFDAKRVYIIASGSLSRQTDNIKKLEKALDGKVVGVRHGMTPHTLCSEVLEIIHDTREAKADLIITCGAGSLTDAAKIIALALANNVSTVEDLIKLHVNGLTDERPDLKAPTIPVISIPTSLSGGEYTRPGGATDDRNHRKQLFPSRGPLLVILDPQLTTTTPDSIWLSTGIRSVDHCVEAMCSLEDNPGADERATRGLKALVPGLLRCKANANDLDARLDCQLGVIDAIGAIFFEKAPLGGSHGIGHQLGPLGVGHGETSCIMLPSVCKYNANTNPDQQAKVRKVFWQDDVVKKVLQNHGLQEQTADLGDCLKAIVKELGLPGSLSDVGVGEDKFDMLAENSLSDFCCATNPIPLKEKEQVIEILKMAL
ncbi:Dehydroquinate synthase-like protein, partial [Aureobasidium melanogenum]